MEMQKNPKHRASGRGDSGRGEQSSQSPRQRSTVHTKEGAWRFRNLSLKIWSLDLCSSPCSVPSWPQFLHQEDGVILITPSPGSQESR